MTEKSSPEALDHTAMNLYQKLAAIMGQIDKVGKTGKNTQQNYAFIEQAVIVAKIRPLLASYGVMIFPEVVEHDLEYHDKTTKGQYGEKTTTTVRARIKSRYTIVNADNPEERMVTEWAAESNDTSDKATNKATTASQKTFLMKLFNISDKDDPDADTVETPPKGRYVAPPPQDEAPPPDDDGLGAAPVTPIPDTDKQLLQARATLSKLGVPTKVKLTDALDSAGVSPLPLNQLSRTELAKVISWAQKQTGITA